MITRKIVNTKQVKLFVPKADYYSCNSGESYGSLESLIDTEGDEILDGFDLKFNNQILYGSVERVPYCCGILEIGDIKVDKNFNIPELTKFLDLITNQEKGITLMINTNGKADCIIFEKALAKCKNWICVKSFKNANSNNIISMWVSKNE